MNKLYRSQTNRMVGGVCGGLGEHFGIDPTLVRLLFVFLTLLGGHGLLIYLVFLIVVPNAPLTSVPYQPQNNPPEAS